MIASLILPWPSRQLHPNARLHWARKAKATKAARAQAFALARAAGWGALQLPAGRLHLHLDFYPPDRRRRDDDGLLASMKAARDGLADALGIDDSRFISHPCVRDEVRKGGEVRIRITAGEHPCSPNP
ncbi:endodeoxyribonuclease RusA [Pseudoxanthomonas suwonensis 11-1]|uniref:Endodeoxyribonuclease RusA n=1 Tax=Pseudoxanthomonas suwonensis (strain 11-1) TaxID=743721 RepID=E6WS53_PSEUU|nr:endodeoxyribonuclease RusA [Pseudoxanthomonas suwonensis 11-1]